MENSKIKRVLSIIMVSIMVMSISFSMQNEMVDAANNIGSVKNLNAKRTTEFKRKLTWNKVKRATGYQIQTKYEYSDGTGWSPWKVYKKTKNNKLITSEIYGACKFRVRAYKTKKNGKKQYGKYSKTVTSYLK